MGTLIDGIWHSEDSTPISRSGRFERGESQFRQWVSADGADGATGFKAEAGRYHLYVADACPWAHRTVIFRALKGLQDTISLSVVKPLMLENGWELDLASETSRGPVGEARYLHEVYTAAKPDYTGRVSVPVLWDKKTGTIVNNESSEIIRMLNRAFDAFSDASVDFYPADLAAEIDRINAVVYDTVNNGVYKCGFARRQEAYDEAFDQLFKTLDAIDRELGKKRYLLGERVTEADWRLFTTLVRFDAVYYGHFKCNLRRIGDYANLSGYLRELYQVPGIAETVKIDQIKLHYYGSHRSINPTGIVPKGPRLDFDAPHGRDHLPAQAASKAA